ncbi:MAG: hypothetical protein JOZ46_01965 [Candidatus Dormibacteraeota bacterium]|nr:hypothetical protein [Candidatus Dormibacteraeota bacterium]MBV9524562.1 hypothetical protein [Candidatus Dormibacteraeota bacterium]
MRAAKQLLVDLPRSLRLAYCLMRDPRVPAYVKAAFAGSLVLIATPVVNLPQRIPVVGQLDVVALTALSVRLFISACPRYVVEEQEQLIVERRSRFDSDVRRGERIAVALYQRWRPGDVDVLGTPHEGAGAAQGATA